MKVVKKQRNSKMCVICGMDNASGVHAPFYVMEDNSVATLFQYREEHQSYPGRVHGGMITAMLDELGCRAYWAYDEEGLAVTMSLDTKYRRPVPYGVPLKGVGKIVKNSRRGFDAEAALYDMDGNLLANAVMRYLKLPVEKIADADYHEEMCYFLPDAVTEID